MEIMSIKTEGDYEAALEEIARLMDAAPETPEGDRLNVLARRVEAYETKHHHVADPEPIEASQRRPD